MKLFISIISATAVFAIGSTVSAVEATFTGSATMTTTSAVPTESAYGKVGVAFVLDASRSADDGTIERFIWKQVEGPKTVTITNASTAKASFTPPTAGTYEFELSVTDSRGTTSLAKRVEVVVTSSQVVPLDAPDDSTEAGPAYLEIDTIKGETSDGAKKGNVEVNWKVEEGEKLETTGVEPDEIDFMGESEQATNFGVLLGGGSEDDDAEFRGGVKVAAGDVNGLTEEEKQMFLSAVKAHAQVTSGQGLENFAIGILVENENMEEISLNYEKIKLSHRARGKFLGFIPVSLTEVVEIETEGENVGEVKVKFSWLSFLTSKEVKASELETAIKAEISTNLGNNENWDFGSRALALSLVSNVLKTKHDTAKNSINNVR